MTGTKEQNAPDNDDKGIDYNDMFTFDKEQDEIDADDDLKEFDDVEFNPDNEEEQEEEQEEENLEEDLFQENNEEEGQEEEEEENEFTDQDLALFNKKLGKEFSDVEELKKFLSAGDNKDAAKKDGNELEKAEQVLAYVGPLLDRSKTSDEDLMRKEYETLAINAGQDIAHEDVQFEIDEKIEKLKDAYQLDLRAEKVRAELRKVYDQHNDKKTQIAAEQATREAQAKKADTEAVQDAFAEIFKREDFFGIKPEKSVIQEAYKRVNSGEFLSKLQSDKQALAKLAVIDAYEKEIHKKASSGLTYSDGIKAVRDEFKGVKEKSSGTVIANAQKRGSAGSASGGSSALISSLTR